jgi:hypothetical protein
MKDLRKQIGYTKAAETPKPTIDFSYREHVIFFYGLEKNGVFKSQKAQWLQGR